VGGSIRHAAAAAGRTEAAAFAGKRRNAVGFAYIAMYAEKSM
jgi:hypothetical protein